VPRPFGLRLGSGWAPLRSKAAIGALHVGTPGYDETDWQRITALYH